MLPETASENCLGKLNFWIRVVFTVITFREMTKLGPIVSKRVHWPPLVSFNPVVTLSPFLSLLFEMKGTVEAAAQGLGS